MPQGVRSAMPWSRRSILPPHSSSISAASRRIMVFDGRWKYIHASGFRPMLYDLLSDPQEFADRGEDPSCADVVARLQSVLFDWALHPKDHITISRETIAASGSQLHQVKRGILIGIWDEAELSAIRQKIGIQSP